jgi:hypothetical protein
LAIISTKPLDKVCVVVYTKGSMIIDKKDIFTQHIGSIGDLSQHIGNIPYHDIKSFNDAQGDNLPTVIAKLIEPADDKTRSIIIAELSRGYQNPNYHFTTLPNLAFIDTSLAAQAINISQSNMGIITEEQKNMTRSTIAEILSKM